MSSRASFARACAGKDALSRRKKAGGFIKRPPVFFLDMRDPGRSFGESLFPAEPWAAALSSPLLLRVWTPTFVGVTSKRADRPNKYVIPAEAGIQTRVR